MPQLKTYDLFISHAWIYNDEYYRLVKMLNEATNFSWRNYSVPEHGPVSGGSDRVLRQQLDRQVRPVNAVLILSGMYAAHRRWIDEELSLAESYRKPIIGIVPRGQQRVPTSVQSAAKEMVSWNTSSIVAAVRRRAI